MRDIPDSLAAAWADGLFIGDRKPIARVTVQHPDMYLQNYSLVSTFTEKVKTDVKSSEVTVTIDPAHGQKVRQTYADFLFTGQDQHLQNVAEYVTTLYIAAGRPPVATVADDANVSTMVVSMALAGKLTVLRILTKIVVALDGNTTLLNTLFNERRSLRRPMELSNVKSVEWSRTVDADVADCTINVWNTRPLEIGETPLEEDLDYPGYYTYSRGGAKFTTRWKHAKNEWFGMLVPDNIIRTYEGYGFDPDAPPELDENLVQTGVWLIDSVTMSNTGTMAIKCRDIGRILIDQMFYPPVVPDDFYNEGFRNWDGKFPTAPKTNKIRVKAQDSSNTPWIGSGTVRGHKLSWAFDGDPNTYWLSIGNDRPSRRFAYEWVQCSVAGKSVDTVKLRTKKKGYTYYVSVKVGGVWQGKNTMNYHEDGIGHNGADIHYVASGHVGTEGFITVDLPKTYTKVQSVRVTLSNLQNFGFGPYKYRGGIRDVEVFGPDTKASSRGFTRGPAGSNPGHYNDYTDIVKLLCGWGGFYWPYNGRQRISDGGYRKVAPATFDTAALGKGVKGRIWGDFMQSGTSGPSPLSASEFDKKSLMDGISYIRDILGFIFMIDETGGVQWRLPNVFNFGCLVSTLSENPGYKKGTVHQIDEKSVLLSLDSNIDAKNVREAFFVGDAAGKIGAFAPGFNPNPTGLRRMAGWSDQNFAPETDKNGKSTKAQVHFAEQQAQLMADMLSLRQLFTYRTDRVQIPANPAIQIDDQVQIWERVSAEGYVHYVKGISSSLDMSTGDWTYDLDTHWLGESPTSKWLFKTEDLFPVTKATITKQLKLAELSDEYIRMKQELED